MDPKIREEQNSENREREREREREGCEIPRNRRAIPEDSRRFLLLRNSQKISGIERTVFYFIVLYNI